MITFGRYDHTVSDVKDRRARKKAQTRESIRTVARRMFGEHGFDVVTIADVAREADVAVQTVFNHFATKEELFFDGRTPWVDGPADAVRSREPGVPPLTVLRAYLVETVGQLVASHSSPEHCCYIATLEASDTLRAQERELVHEAEIRLAAALLEAWSADHARDVPGAPACPATAAPLVAAIWLTAARSLVVGQRVPLTEGADPGKAAAAVMDLADRMFGDMMTSVELVHGPSGTASRADTGWPHNGVRRAG
jgi:AcrR family transcriptional regulator